MQYYIQKSSRQCNDRAYRCGSCDHPDRLERVAEIYRSLCRTTCCEKGFRSLNPLAFTPFTHFPPVATASKLIPRTGSLEIQFRICVEKFVFFFRLGNLRLSAILWGVYFPRKFNLASLPRILNWAARERNPFSLSDQSLERKFSEVWPWRVRS